MATPKTGKPRGRPKKDFERDPDRYAIAYAEALRAVHSISEIAAYQNAVPLATQAHIQLPDPVPAQDPAHLVPVGIEIARRPGAPVTLKGRARTLIQKARREMPPEEALVQATLTMMFTAAIGRIDLEVAARIIVDLAVSIDEQEYAERILIPALMKRG